MANKTVFFRSLQGLLLSQGAPVGWFLIQEFFNGSILGGLGVYLYMSLGTSIVFTLFGAYVGHSEDLLEQLAATDALTGLYNKRNFNERLAQEYVRAQRLQTPVCLALIDIDFFKQVNDHYGHLVGDDVLKAVSKELKRCCRRGEVISRVGGEEFCIILSGVDEAQGKVAAERFKAAIDQVEVNTRESLVKVTVSIGVSALVPRHPDDRSELYSCADKAMYYAKEHGRNQICVFSEIPPKGEASVDPDLCPV